MMTGIEAWAISQFISVDWKETAGMIFMLVYILDSTYLSYHPEIPANSSLQRFAPLLKALGDKLAPPAVSAAIAACTKAQVQEDKILQVPTNEDVLQEISKKSSDS
jgi:hypothetical protein